MAFRLFAWGVGFTLATIVANRYSRYTQPDPAGGDIPAHSMVLEWWATSDQALKQKEIHNLPDLKGLQRLHLVNLKIGTPWWLWWHCKFLSLMCPCCVSDDVHFPQHFVTQDQWCRCYLGWGRAGSQQICKDRMLKILSDGEDSEKILRKYSEDREIGFDMIDTM